MYVGTYKVASLVRRLPHKVTLLQRLLMPHKLYLKVTRVVGIFSVKMRKRRRPIPAANSPNLLQF